MINSNIKMSPSISAAFPQAKKAKLTLASSFAFSNCLLNAKNILASGSAFLASINSTLNLLVMGLSAILYLWSFFVVEKRIKFTFKQAFVLISIFLFWFFSFLVNLNLFSYSHATEELIYFLTYCFPAIFILPMLKNLKELLEAFHRYKWIVFWALVISILFILRNGVVQFTDNQYTTYSMAFGRAVLPVCLLMFQEGIDQKKPLPFIFGLFCTASIFFFGSRFPLLCIASYLVWKFFQKGINLKKILIASFLILLFVIILLNISIVVKRLSSFLSAFGINSRSLSLLDDGTFENDSGRSEIFKRLIEQINKSPVFGYGAGGANIVLNNGLSHSFYLDLFANMGYFFGGIFLLITFSAIIVLFKRRNDYFGREFIIICICLFLPISFIQTSLWRATYFWYLLALCLGPTFLKNKENVNRV